MFESYPCHTNLSVDGRYAFDCFGLLGFCAEVLSMPYCFKRESTNHLAVAFNDLRTSISLRSRRAGGSILLVKPLPYCWSRR